MLKQGQLVTVLDDFAPPPVDGFFLFYGLHRSYPAGAQHQDGITMSAAPIPSQAKIARAEKPLFNGLTVSVGRRSAVQMRVQPDTSKPIAGMMLTPAAFFWQPAARFIVAARSNSGSMNLWKGTCGLIAPVRLTIRT